MSTFVLANDTLRLEFDRDTGALVDVATADGGWQLLDRPQLGLSFRLLVPLPGRRNNPVLGEKQRLTTSKSPPTAAAPASPGTASPPSTAARSTSA